MRLNSVDGDIEEKPCVPITAANSIDMMLNFAMIVVERRRVVVEVHEVSKKMTHRVVDFDAKDLLLHPLYYRLPIDTLQIGLRLGIRI